MPGQINLDTTFGKAIYEVCKNENYKVFCEIGSWNGEGSTVCILQSLLDKNSKDNIFYSIEANNYMHQLAINYHQNKYEFLRGTDSILKLLYGKVNNTKMMSSKEVEEHPLFNIIKGHYDLHYLDEKNSFENSPYVGDQLPKEIDVVLLDGGEFSTDGDFDFFKDKNVKVFMLDDVNVIKCNQIRKDLLNNKNFVLYKEDLSERNGWSIFIRV